MNGSGSEADGAGDAGGAPRPPAEDALPKTAVRALQRLLAERQLTQQALATELGVTASTVSRWLTRAQGMPFGTLRRICAYLGVRVEDLFVERRPAGGGAGGGAEALTARLEGQLEALVRTMDRLRDASRAVPLYRLGAAGDPRRGEDDGGLVPVSFVQRPIGTARAVGPRGFALVVDDDRLERRGLHPGDVVFCNPGEPFGDGSLCVVGLAGEAGAGPLALRELVARRGNLDARTAPPAGAPSTTPAGDFFPYAPVTALQAVWTLPEGRGHPDDLHRLGRQPRPGPRGTPLDYSSDAGGDGPLAVRR